MDLESSTSKSIEGTSESVLIGDGVSTKNGHSIDEGGNGGPSMSTSLTDSSANVAPGLQLHTSTERTVPLPTPPPRPSSKKRWKQEGLNPGSQQIIREGRSKHVNRRAPQPSSQHDRRLPPP